MIDFYQPFSSAPWVFVDLETSGVDPSRCRVIEVAVARYELSGGFRQMTGKLNALINPEMPIDDYSDFHRRQGITNALLKAAKPWGSYANEVAQLLDGGVFISHNAAFDLRFLKLEQARIARENPVQATLCTLELARKILVTGVGHSLGALEVLYELKAEGLLHRAWHDVEIMRQLFEGYLVDRLLEAEMDVFNAVHYSRTCKLSPGMALLFDSEG